MLFYISKSENLINTLYYLLCIQCLFNLPSIIQDDKTNANFYWHFLLVIEYDLHFTV